MLCLRRLLTAATAAKHWTKWRSQRKAGRTTIRKWFTNRTFAQNNSRLVRMGAKHGIFVIFTTSRKNQFTWWQHIKPVNSIWLTHKNAITKMNEAKNKNAICLFPSPVSVLSIESKFAFRCKREHIVNFVCYFSWCFINCDKDRFRNDAEAFLLEWMDEENMVFRHFTWMNRRKLTIFRMCNNWRCFYHFYQSTGNICFLFVLFVSSTFLCDWVVSVWASIFDLTQFSVVKIRKICFSFRHRFYNKQVDKVKVEKYRNFMPKII